MLGIIPILFFVFTLIFCFFSEKTKEERAKIFKKTDNSNLRTVLICLTAVYCCNTVCNTFSELWKTGLKTRIVNEKYEGFHNQYRTFEIKTY